VQGTAQKNQEHDSLFAKEKPDIPQAQDADSADADSEEAEVRRARAAERRKTFAEL